MKKYLAYILTIIVAMAACLLYSQSKAPQPPARTQGHAASSKEQQPEWLFVLTAETAEFKQGDNGTKLLYGII